MIPPLELFPPDRADAIQEALRATVAQFPAGMTLRAAAANLRAQIPYGVEPSDLISWTSQLPGIIATLPTEPRIGKHSIEEVVFRTQSWKHLRWRQVVTEPLSPAANVALDELLLDGDDEAVIRFWDWSEPAVVLGRTQSVANELDMDECQRHDIAIVRRISGGGTMLVTPSGSITVSLILPESTFTGLPIRESYEFCDAWIIQTLRSLGVDIHHVPINDLACSEGKIGGAAQARRRGKILHHVTIAYDLDTALMGRLIRIGAERVHEKGTRSAAKTVAPLRRQLSSSREFLIDRLQREFQTQFGGNNSPLDAREVLELDRRVRDKFGTREWIESF